MHGAPATDDTSHSDFDTTTVDKKYLEGVLARSFPMRTRGGPLMPAAADGVPRG